MQDKETAAALRELVAELRTQNAARESATAERAERKDRWDKFANVSTFLSSVVIAAVGLVFTSCYNMRQADRERDERRQQLAVQQVEIVQKLMPQLTGSQDEKKLALLAISALGNTKLATDLAVLDRSAGSRQALEAIAASPDQGSSQLAKVALDNFRRYQPELRNLLGGSVRGRRLLSVALAEAQTGVFEEGGDNRGPRIRKYLSSIGAEDGTPWAGAFLSWCIQQVVGTQISPSGSFDGLKQGFQAKGWLRTLSAADRPQSGDVLFWPPDATAAGRTRRAGIVVEPSPGDSVLTVEGNTGEAGDQNGALVLLKKGKLLPGMTVGRIPD